MRRTHYIYAAWLALLAALLVGAVVIPARAANSSAHSSELRQNNNASSLNATIYISLGMLEPRFQSSIAQQVPAKFYSAINNALSKVPQQDQGWVRQMVTTLLQPSATLTGLSVQSNGLAMSLRITLYPGDPEPITGSLLISFQVINSSIVQVNAEPLNGSPALASGPQETFQVPMGQLYGINTTPSCGNAALALHLRFPVAMGQATTQVQNTALTTDTPQNGGYRSARYRQNVPANADSYVEIPASSLAAMGSSISAMPVGKGLFGETLTAQNIQIGVQGSDLVITSDIYDAFFGQIATAVTTMAPTASNGSLAVQVLNTTIYFLQVIPISYNSYNAQIQQTLNSKLNGAFAGRFYVTQAEIGPNAGVPCAAGNSLVLSGFSSLG